MLEPRELERGLEREVDVVAQEDVARLRLGLEGREAVAAGARSIEQLAVVREIERAAHSTTTSSRRAATSARSSASTFVSAIAIT